MFKEIIKRGLLGFMIGVFIGQTILIINSLIAGNGIFYAVNPFLIDKQGAQLTLVIIQYFLTGVIGATFASCSIIFQTDKWSLLKQTIIHFLITSIVMFTCGAICHWFELNAKSAILWFAVYLFYYILFWIGFTLYYKIQIKKMNKNL